MTTIFALSTPWGRSGIAVIRISGPGTRATLEAITRRAAPKGRTLVKRRLWPAYGAVGAPPIDEAMVAFLPGPSTYSGEDMAELYVHGGPAVIAATLQELGLRADHRLAEPGEFTKRAFHNGKLDLVEIEGLADLIAAETEAQRIQALRQADGEASGQYENWRAGLIRLMAMQEATIDFSDEDIPAEIADTVADGMAELAAGIEGYLDDARCGERLRDGLAIAILGAPNVGKSSLLNRLAGREAAIVTAIAGTTRDVIEVRLDLFGMPVTLADTAGLRESLDEVESEGIRRALDRAKASDLMILLFDAGTWPAGDPETRSLIDERAILVLNKCDLGTVAGSLDIDGKPVIKLSARSGHGIEDLVAEIRRRASAVLPKGDGPVITRARHRAALTEAAGALRRGLAHGAPELKAEELRLAARALGRLVGRIDVEDLLDGIFAEFCIGK